MTIAQLTSAARSVLARMPERFSDADVIPERLVCLFRMALLVEATAPEFIRALTERLLDLTLRQAIANSVYYRERLTATFERHAGRFRLEELPDLSAVDRREVELHGSAMRRADMEFGFATYTSGTTSGRPLIIDRSKQEQDFVSKFFSLMGSDGSDERGLALNLATFFHGQPIEVPNRYRCLPVSGGSFSGLCTSHDLLLRKFRFAGQMARISAVGGPLISLLRLTAYLETKTAGEQLPPIRFVQSTSEYMSSAARRRIEGFWRCPVEDRFGLSETLPGAWRCHTCGAFHFEPYGIYEIVGFGDLTPISSGPGRLVLTGFYPFMQMTPLIRYITGDVVERADGECPSGPSVRLLGRFGSSLMQGGRFVLGEYEIVEILDEEPDVFRHRQYPAFPEYLQEVGAPPVFRFVDALSGESGIEVGVRFDPVQFPERARALEARLTTALSRRAPRPVPLRLTLGTPRSTVHTF